MATYSYITQNGTIVPDTAQIKADVEQELIDSAGLSVAPDPSSAEGRLIDSEITSRISVARNNALLANQQNPNLSIGTFLDAHLALIGSARDGAERSTVDCDLTGVPGTLIPAGQYAEDDNRVLWELASTVILSASGLATATFRALVPGPVDAAIGSITKISTGVVGWETINNPAGAVPGKFQQGDASARRQRRLELGGNSRSNAFSILAAVSAVENVAGVRFLENFESTEQVIQGVTLKPHSTWVAVDGGVDAQIAAGYFTSKTGGSGFNGSVTVSYVEPSSGQTIPVQFERPTDKPLICRVTARVGTSVSGIADIKRAAVQYANGEINGELGFYLGEDSSPFEVAAGVNAQLADVFILKCELATKAAGDTAYSTDTIDNEIYEKASLLEVDVEVVAV
jgi:uncharacterized phage protein gp47/JayE